MKYKIVLTMSINLTFTLGMCLKMGLIYSSQREYLVTCWSFKDAGIFWGGCITGTRSSYIMWCRRLDVTMLWIVISKMIWMAAKCHVDWSIGCHKWGLDWIWMRSTVGTGTVVQLVIIHGQIVWRVMIHCVGSEIEVIMWLSCLMAWARILRRRSLMVDRIEHKWCLICMRWRLTFQWSANKILARYLQRSLMLRIT